MKVINQLLTGIIIFEMGVTGAGMVWLSLTAIFTEPPPMCAPGEAQLARVILTILGGAALVAARKGLRVNFSI